MQEREEDIVNSAGAVKWWECDGWFVSKNVISTVKREGTQAETGVNEASENGLVLVMA